MAAPGPRGARTSALAALSLALALALAGTARAQEAPGPDAGERAPEAEEAPGRTTVTARTSYYAQEDRRGTRGNPFADETLTVIEPVLLLDHQADADTGWSVQLSHDLVTSASIAKLDNFPLQSGASGDYYFGLDLGLRQRVAPGVELGVGAHGSFERDYRSFGGSARVTLTSADGNDALTIAGRGFFDTVVRIGYDGINRGPAARRTGTLELTYYRALTPWLHGEAGTSLTWQEGALETPLNSFVVAAAFAGANPYLVGGFAGFEHPEALPERRLRGAWFARARALLPTGTALELGGRYYADSWGLTAVTLEPALHQWLVRDLLRARVLYRHHVQRAADAYDRFFAFSEGALPYRRTQDPDLGAFRSHAVGLGLTLDLAPWRLDVGVDRVWRSDGLHQWWATAGLRVDL